MATNNFDLLDLADGESGDAAVSVVVSKKKTEAAAAAKPTDAAEHASEPAAKEKSKDFYYTKLQHDEGVRLCVQELRRLKDVLRKLKVEETKLKEQPGNEARLEELSDEQRKLKQEESKLLDQERELLLQKEAFYRVNGMTLSLEDCFSIKKQLDDGVRLFKQEQRRLSDVLRELRGEETKLKEQPGNEARLEELSDEQRKLMQEQRKLWDQQMELLLQKEAFYRANGGTLSGDEYDYAMQQLDEGVRLCQQEVTRLREVLIKLRGQETKLREQPGNEARLEELSDQQRALRQEQRKLREEEVKLLQKKKAMVSEYEEKPSKGANEDSRSNYNGVNGDVYNNNDGGSCGYSDYGGNNDMYDGGEHYPQGHDERHLGRGHDHYNKQGYRQGQPRKQVYRPKVKASSDAGTEAEEKPEASVVSAIDTEQKEATADNADVVPASESDKSAARGAAQDGPHNGQGAPTGFNKNPFQKRGTVNGSEKRKKKNAKKNSGTEPDKVKKQDSEGDGLKKQADNLSQPEEEKKTLAEYERIREEKKKSLEASKTETRKVAAEFKGMKMLEKRKLDDEEAAIKVEKAPPKVKEASKKVEVVQAEGKEADGKPKKVIIPRQNLGFIQPRRVTYNVEDGSFSRVRSNNGGFQGGSRNNSTEPQVNGREPQNEAGSHNGNGAPQSAYNARGDGAMRGDYSGQRDGCRGNGGYGRGNGGYGYGRGHGGYQGNGGYQQQRRYQPRRPAVPNVKDVYKFPALPVPASARQASEAPTAPAKASAPAAAPAQA